MLKKISLALVAVITASVAMAGLWNNFPKVGSDRYCITYVNGVCSQYAPAGPATLTGNETIPADTNLSNGQQPQTVIVPINLINGNALAMYTGATISQTIPDNIYNIILSHSTTISTANLALPANPIDGQRIRVGTNQTVSTLSVHGGASGYPLASGTPTVITASTTGSMGYEWVFSATAGKWYRLQ